MKYKVTLEMEEIVEPVIPKDLINSLEYWARMFREELLSDQFAEDIANVLADRAHDLRLEQEDA